MLAVGRSCLYLHVVTVRSYFGFTDVPGSKSEVQREERELMRMDHPDDGSNKKSTAEEKEAKATREGSILKALKKGCSLSLYLQLHGRLEAKKSATSQLGIKCIGSPPARTSSQATSTSPRRSSTQASAPLATTQAPSEGPISH